LSQPRLTAISPSRISFHHIIAKLTLSLKTEAPSAQHTLLDEYPVEDLVNAFIDDQIHAVNAVRAVSAQIAAAGWSMSVRAPQDDWGCSIALSYTPPSPGRRNARWRCWRVGARLFIKPSKALKIVMKQALQILPP
jgi:hypothetical protein